MTQHIYKYNFTSDGLILMPRAAQILKIGFDPDRELCIWALVDPEHVIGTRIIEKVGTGWPFDPRGKAYLETIIDGLYVWHFWEALE